MNRTRKTVPGGFYIRAEAGDVNLQAATADDGKTLRRFTMTAYTGGAMALAGWPYPVVVDLTGLVLGKKSRPILMNHDTARIVGHTDTVGVEGTALTVAGVISGVGSAAREVVGASDNGFPWQASLGAAVKKVVFVPEGKTAAANGKEFAGPVYMVRQAKLGEVSFAALGADDATTAKVEAGRRFPANNKGTSCHAAQRAARVPSFLLLSGAATLRAHEFLHPFAAGTFLATLLALPVADRTVDRLESLAGYAGCHIDLIASRVVEWSTRSGRAVFPMDAMRRADNGTNAIA